MCQLFSFPRFPVTLEEKKVSFRFLVGGNGDNSLSFLSVRTSGKKEVEMLTMFHSRLDSGKGRKVDFAANVYTVQMCMSCFAFSFQWTLCCHEKKNARTKRERKKLFLVAKKMFSTNELNTKNGSKSRRGRISVVVVHVEMTIELALFD